MRGGGGATSREFRSTPSLAPRAPPSRLKPETERMKVVVFLRERKLGAGHRCDFRRRKNCPVRPSLLDIGCEVVQAKELDTLGCR